MLIVNLIFEFEHAHIRRIYILHLFFVPVKLIIYKT